MEHARSKVCACLGSQRQREVGPLHLRSAFTAHNGGVLLGGHEVCVGSYLQFRDARPTSLRVSLHDALFTEGQPFAKITAKILSVFTVYFQPSFGAAPQSWIRACLLHCKEVEHTLFCCPMYLVTDKIVFFPLDDPSLVLFASPMMVPHPNKRSRNTLFHNTFVKKEVRAFSVATSDSFY
ncbi:hypothetical protein QOT17_021761 [Balamuthia mandrillaris]